MTFSVHLLNYLGIKGDNMYKRYHTRKVKVGKIEIGGGAPVSIQSMCNVPTSEVQAVLKQTQVLANAGCDITRCAIPDQAALKALPEILSQTPIPVVADIHFDYKLALGAIAAGIHAVRINPGNIGSADRVRKVAEAAGEAGIPIRVGANSGSLPKGLYESKLASGLSPEDAMAESLAEAALDQAALLEQFGFHDIVVSLKSSSPSATVLAGRAFAERSDLPQHIGVTEAGIPAHGIVKSAVGIGTLLMEGIGDTMRVSLTSDPIQEIRTAIAILEACGLREAEPELVSCPTCGRTKINLEAIAAEINDFINDLKAQGTKINLKKIAVMGCIVNGPGEASHADIGLAGGEGKAAVFAKGKVIATRSEREAVEFLKNEIQKNTLYYKQ